jgi:hypothetical protein
VIWTWAIWTDDDGAGDAPIAAGEDVTLVWRTGVTGADVPLGAQETTARRQRLHSWRRDIGSADARRVPDATSAARR